MDSLLGMADGVDRGASRCRSSSALRPPPSVFPPIPRLRCFSYLLRASAIWGGQGRRCVFSDSCITKGLGRGPEKWHASNTVAPGQVQLNLSLRISHSRSRRSLWSSGTLSQGPVFLACRWTWTVCPPLPALVASLVALRVCSAGDIFP